jgi:3',5'-cyclic AMP phosphodiesterase CpdA
MKIAHLSDLHLLALDGVSATRFMNKRAIGWLNIRLKRGSVHRISYARAILRQIGLLGVEHVVITGDLTNLALESEFALARDVLERGLGLDPSRVTIVPGNHDVYTRGSARSRRFERSFAPWLESDLPELATEVPGGRFPIVKLRGPVAIIGLSSAVARPPMVAAGELGRGQLASLARVLAHPEVVRRGLVLALHHPPLYRGESPLKTYFEGLRDAPELLAQIRMLSRGLLLHGHLHRRVQRAVPSAGSVVQVGATSASLHHDALDRMAGFNVYEIDEVGALTHACAHVYSPTTGDFLVRSVPVHVAGADASAEPVR